MRHRAFKAGEVLFHKGDLADTLIYIARGELKLVEIGRSVGAGELIGEIGLFSPGKQRTQTLVCETGVELYHMTDEMTILLCGCGVGPAIIKSETTAFADVIEDTTNKLLNTLNTFSANTYRERRLLAKGLNLDAEKDSNNLQGFAAMDQTKVQLVYDEGRSAYNVYALSAKSKVAFCFYDASQPGTPSASQYAFIEAGPAALSDKKSCYQSVVDAPAEDSTRGNISQSPVFFPRAAAVKEPSRYCGIYNRFAGAEVVNKVNDYPRLELRMHIRSVGKIFQFLGDLLQYQDEIKQHLEDNRQLNLKLNTPVTFGYCGDHPTPGCDDIFIRLDGNPCNACFTLTYREREYAVGNFNASGRAGRGDAACRPDNLAGKDHTLEILSVLHQLVGLNKSAADLRATPFVQVLP